MGALSHKSALRLAYYRGLLASKLAKTTQTQIGMMAIGLSQEQALALIQNLKPKEQSTPGHITVACINSPRNITVAGPSSLLDILRRHLEEEQLFARKLMVPVGYHSSQMNEIAEEYLQYIQDLEPGQPTFKTTMMSSVTCEPVSPQTLANSEYWVQNMVSPVNFLDAIRRCSGPLHAHETTKKLDRSHLSHVSIDVWLEVGPHAALQGPIRDILTFATMNAEVKYISTLRRRCSGLETVLEAAGQLHCHGVDIDIERLNRHGDRKPQVLTDLPQYAFDHSVLFWEESRLSREFRTRPHGNNELLGCQVTDWNPQEPAWRLVIKPDEMPWIHDHKLNGSVLYPAAGMLTMAIEAIRQLAHDRPIVGFEIKDAIFPTPLLLSMQSEGQETQFCLRKTTDPTNEGSCWYQYRLYSHQANGWEEICRGSVRADYGRPDSEIDGGKEAKRLLEIQKETFAAAAVSCTNTMTSEDLYRRFQGVGLEYGPSFRLLSSIAFDGTGEATATISASCPSIPEFTSSHIIHPSTLDCMMQVIFAALTGATSDETPTMVPTRIDRLWVANSETTSSSAEPIRVHTRASKYSRRSARSKIIAMGTVSQKTKVQMDGFEVTGISTSSTVSDILSQKKRHCYHMEWNIDLSMLGNEEIERYCAKALNPEAEPVEWFQDLDFMTLAYGYMAIEEIQRLNRAPTPPIHKYFLWMQNQLARDSLATYADETHKLAAHYKDFCRLDAVCERLSDCKRGQLYVKVGRSLTKIMLGDVDPLQLIFDDQDLVSGFYEEVNQMSQSFNMMARYLGAYVHKDPGMAFLEVGAGTGATTSVLHNALISQDQNPWYETYDFTDISPSFFAKAKEKFNAYSRMNYRVLDIEGDVSAQGYQDGSYHMVIAANVLHATKDLRTTLRNVRRLLKPNGKLILMEITEPQKTRMGFVFGLLPGWWLSAEGYRQQSPCISKKEWAQVLKDTGFSGTDLTFPDFQNEACHGWDLMVSTAVPTSPSSAPVLPRPPMPEALLIVDKTSIYQLELGAALQHGLQAQDGSVPRILDLEAAGIMEDRDSCYFIVLVEIEHPLLRRLSSHDFKILQALLSSSGGIVWVTRGGGEAPEPDFGMINGLARVQRQENNKTPLVTVALDFDAQHQKEHHAGHIAKIFRSTILGLQNGSFEPEFLEKDGNLHVNRVVEAKSLNEHICGRTTLLRYGHRWGETLPLKMHFSVPGLLDSLEFREDHSSYGPLASDEAEIRLQAIGVNFKECLTALGRVNSDTFGSECSGIITRTGSDVNDFACGDRVALLVIDSYRSFARQKASRIVRIPDNVSFVEAAAIPTAFVTSWYSLCEIARLQKGEKILIHAASGGTGQAAIQIAKYVGAEIFATVSSTIKKDLLVATYAIPEDHIFYSRDTSFADGIKRVTGIGVDVILNSLSGEGLIASWECIAPYGRFLEIGRKDIDSRGSLPMFHFSKNVSFTGIDLAAIASERPALVQSILTRIFALVASEELHPAFPIHKFCISRVEQAFRFIQSGRSSGKIVIEAKPDAEVQVRRNCNHFRHLSTNGDLGCAENEANVLV